MDWGHQLQGTGAHVPSLDKIMDMLKLPKYNCACIIPAHDASHFQYVVFISFFLLCVCVCVSVCECSAHDFNNNNTIIIII